MSHIRFSKILVQRLKDILSHVVSENQAAYITGRHISDNVLLANEVFHSLKARERCARSYMAVKIDISKAYDRLEWSFLEKVLRKKGFCDVWIGWIMECISSVSFSVLTNGSPYGHFLPTRGIRQVNPLSPYLYILCADVLSSMMDQAFSEHNIQPLCISVGGPPVSHLLFADDSLFFLKEDISMSKH